MVRWLWIVFGTLRSAVRTHRELALENLALRQQLAVWKRRQQWPKRGLAGKRHSLIPHLSLINQLLGAAPA